MGEKYWLIVKLDGNRNPTGFTDLNAVTKYLADEKEHWLWLDRCENKILAEQISSRIQEIFSTIEQKISRKRPKPLPADVGTLMRSTFGKKGIPVSSSSRAKFIKRLLEQQSANIAAGALSSLIGYCDFTSYEHLNGAIQMVAFDEGLSSESQVSYRDSLMSLESELNNTLILSNKQSNNQRNELAKNKKEIDLYLEKMTSILNEHTDSIIDEKSKIIDGAITSIKDTERAYQEFMSLKAPVKYWSQKARSHRQKSRDYGIVLISYSVLATAVLLFGLSYLSNYSIEVSDESRSSVVYFILATTGVVLTTVVFWIGRIVTRLFLSEHHLAIDAEERSVMVETYLALTAEGAAGPEERKIVLNSLFRPTADGIVKDDAAPDLSPAALISRLNSRV